LRGPGEGVEENCEAGVLVEVRDCFVAGAGEVEVCGVVREDGVLVAEEPGSLWMFVVCVKVGKMKGASWTAIMMSVAWPRLNILLSWKEWAWGRYSYDIGCTDY
jgi:hypothetical protein